MTVFNVSTQTSDDYMNIYSASGALVGQYYGYLGVTNYVLIIWNSPFIRFRFISDAAVVSTGIMLNFTIGIYFLSRLLKCN